MTTWEDSVRRTLRGPCDCPPCQAGDEDRCIWVLQLGRMTTEEAKILADLRAQVEAMRVSADAEAKRIARIGPENMASSGDFAGSADAFQAVLNLIDERRAR